MAAAIVLRQTTLLSSSSLSRNNSPDPRRVSALVLWYLGLTAEYRLTRLTTKGDSHREQSWQGEGGRMDYRCLGRDWGQKLWGEN